VCACIGLCVCVRERECECECAWESACVRERERERARDKVRVCVFVSNRQEQGMPELLMDTMLCCSSGVLQYCNKLPLQHNKTFTER